MLTLLAKFKSYLWIGGVILALLTWGGYERLTKQKVQAQYDGFVAEAKAIASIQLAERQRKEKENEERIRLAESDRTAALERLRLATADSGRLRASIHSLTASRTGQVCYRAEGFNAFLSGTTGLVTEGQAAIIDSKSMLDSWPR